MTPWSQTKSFSTVRVPTLVVGAENDSVAPVTSHSIPFYTSLPASLDKAYAELNNASHFAPNSTNTPIGRYSVAWVKRCMDNDTRYETFLCGAPAHGIRDGHGFFRLSLDVPVPVEAALSRGKPAGVGGTAAVQAAAVPLFAAWAKARSSGSGLRRSLSQASPCSVLYGTLTSGEPRRQQSLQLNRHLRP
jgi:hypothetical protein